MWRQNTGKAVVLTWLSDRLHIHALVHGQFLSRIAQLSSGFSKVIISIQSEVVLLNQVIILNVVRLSTKVRDSTQHRSLLPSAVHIICYASNLVYTDCMLLRPIYFSNLLCPFGKRNARDLYAVRHSSLCIVICAVWQALHMMKSQLALVLNNNFSLLFLVLFVLYMLISFCSVSWIMQIAKF